MRMRIARENKVQRMTRNREGRKRGLLQQVVSNVLLNVNKYYDTATATAAATTTTTATMLNEINKLKTGMCTTLTSNYIHIHTYTDICYTFKSFISKATAKKKKKEK